MQMPAIGRNLPSPRRMELYPMKRLALLLLILAATAPGAARADDPLLTLNKGDHVVYIGNTLADRMQHHAWLETYIHAQHPQHQLTFRNLGFSADELKTRPRSANFGDADQWISKCEADVIFCFFGYNEALRGDAALPAFEANLASTIDQMLAKQYNGKSAPRLVFFSPIAHENHNSPHLPNGKENNAKLKTYTNAMKQVCAAKKVAFVDLFTTSQQLYAAAEKPLTTNGIHLLDHGNQAVAGAAFKALFGTAAPAPAAVKQLREAVLEKNYYWFSRYRVVDGYNVYGGRSKLAWHGQSNADVMRREMEIFDVMTANRDKVVWAAANGKTIKPDDNNIPETLAVKTNKPGPLPGGKWPYLDGKSAIDKMKVAGGMEVNLYASEKEFPRLVNPVQMAVDTDSRVWASVWPSYPHWNPVQRREDAIVILPDEDNDGKADKCIVFADKLNSITGFEFWNGGVLVASPPEIWFLKDTDGDDKADLKIRMLQGVSSADTHHSANAMLVGPDGWFYWSRGIFNTASFETPTRTFRSGASGVHRFNPRTFEFEFHFPIGPNPHGDVFDRWGFQFANDGTGGTGSYVNIGKGVGNKKWFQKRVRPVPATGLISGDHFGPEHEGNFLICNAIGFLGVAQHTVKFSGADITATEIEPVVVSSDPNFRPSDVEMGGDGALYISDWHNTLIGHMQHNMRDPNRDHQHGRIYRVTKKGRPLLKPAKMKGKPIAEVCQHFFASDNGTRYRARLELTSRTPDQITKEVGAFAAKLSASNSTTGRDEAQALLECLWVFEEQRLVNMPLLEKVFQAEEPRVRAAAIRTLGHWAGRAENWQKPLVAASRDASPLVRAEAVKAAVDFEGLVPAEVIFETATRPTDPELDAVLRFARSKINVDAVIAEAIKSGAELSAAAQSYVLLNASIADLLKLERTPAVNRAVLSRKNASRQQLAAALKSLATQQKMPQLSVLMQLIAEAQKSEDSNLAGLGSLLADQPAVELKTVTRQIRALALKGRTPGLKRVGYAAWISADGPDDAFLAATKSKERLRDFLDAVPSVDPAVREQLYAKVLPLISALPSHLKAEQTSAALQAQGLKVDFYFPSKKNVARETLAAMKPKASGMTPTITMNTPVRKQNDGFALRFTGQVITPRAGRYVFSIASDDGSRIYLNDQLLVNNDGLHGMVEKSGAVELPAGAHPIMVTYFDNGGGDGLRVTWQGPGIKKQPIPATNLSTGGGETLHDTAIAALAAIPGHDEEKFAELAKLVARGKSRPAAISALLKVPAAKWPQKHVRPLVDNLTGYLSSIPEQYRTNQGAVNAMSLARSLAAKLPADEAAKVVARLQNLNVRVIAIGTVPHRMIFDKEVIGVQAGKTVEFRFSNIDAMPHNFAIVKPGTLAATGMLAEKTGRDADAEARHYIPESDNVLLGSNLIQPGKTQSISFKAPSEPGVYPYVCTYPGHWRRMFGALYVVADLAAYEADSAKYLAAAKLEVKDDLLKLTSRNHDWKFEELIADVETLPAGRNFEVGKSLFQFASCTGCHKLDGQGLVFGPDLAKLDDKKHTTAHILRSIVDPSKDIDQKFQSHVFVLESGEFITGMIVEETATEFKVVIDPLAKGKPTVIKKSEVEDQQKSPVSLMPAGLLNRLTREEILDLIGFVYAGGDKKNAVYQSAP